MLDEMTPRQMDEWIAFGVLEPFGDDWRRSGTVAAEINNSVATDVIDLRDPEDYLPPESRQITRKNRPGRMMTPEEHEKIVAAKSGS